MVVAHRDRLHVARKEARPGIAAIGGAENAIRLGVDHLRVDRIENEELNGIAEIEDAPRLAAIVRDVAARHIAGDDRGARVVRTDGGVEHRTAAAGSDDAPRGWRRRGEREQGESEKRQASHQRLWSHAAQADARAADLLCQFRRLDDLEIDTE